MNISVVGAGGWGTAIAILLSENKHNVTLWSYENDVVDEINNQHTNNRFLPNKIIPQSIKATNNLRKTEKNDCIVLAIPTQHIRSVVSKLDLKNKIIVNLAKGIEQKTLLRISELLIQTCGISPEQYTIITGPSHAEEVAKRIPTTVVAASEHSQYEKQIIDIFTTSYFRIYSLDVVGLKLEVL